jgi:hypothetical protein
VIALHREETGVLVMELSENLWPEDLELAVLAVHDIARSPQNSLLLLVVLDSDFDTPLWDFFSVKYYSREFWPRIALPEWQC